MRKMTSKRDGQGYDGVYWMVPAHLSPDDLKQYIKENGRVFWIDYRVKGERYREKIGREGVRFKAEDGYAMKLTEKRVFEIREIRRHTKLLVGAFPNHSADLTMDEAWGRYLDWAKQHKKSWPNEERLYKKRIRSSIGGIKLKDLSRDKLEKYKLELERSVGREGKLLKPATVKYYFAIIRQVINRMMKMGYFDGPNPVNSIEFRRVDNRITEVLTAEETKQLLEVLRTYPDRNAANFVHFAFLTGLRRGELCKLKWDHVDMKNKVVALHQPKSGDAVEKCFLSPPAIRVIEEQMKNKVSDYIFPGKDGQQRVEIKTAWNSIKKKAGIDRPFRFHGLRHNFASQLAMSGLGVFEVQAVMRHKNITTTERYIARTDQAQRNATNRFAELLDEQE